LPTKSRLGVGFGNLGDALTSIKKKNYIVTYLLSKHLIRDNYILYTIYVQIYTFIPKPRTNVVKRTEYKLFQFDCSNTLSNALTEFS
jgi:hypothetical protein